MDFHENLFDLKKAEKQIKDYIGFVHRNKMQGSFWKNLMAQNLSHLVFYIGDFAMKWIPRPHRETQSQWFGKSGVPWHIGVFLRIIMMNGIPMIETEGHISVLDDDSIQDSNTVLALMKASFAVYKKAHPEVTELTICSDCAGAYRNEKVIVGLWSLRNGGIAKGLKINGSYFSEPGGGKSRADTFGAVAKNHVAKALDSKQDADTAIKFAEALYFRDGIANGVIFCGGIKNKTPMPKSKQIPELQQYRHFEYHKTGTNVKKVSDIGEGKIISLKPIPTDPTYDYEIVNMHIAIGKIFSRKEDIFSSNQAWKN